MPLSKAEVVPYLLGRGLISPQNVVDDGLLIDDVSRRNRNFKVVSVGGPAYLLKQGAYAETAPAIAHEAAVYEALQSLPDYAALARYLPRCYGYDRQQQVLTLELVPAVVDLRAYHAGRRRFSIRVAEAVGTALGTLHRVTLGAPALQNDPGHPAWALSVHRPNHQLMQATSGANVRLIGIIQHYAEFGRLLDELRAAWRPTAFIHNDIKWDNFLVNAAATRGDLGLKLVDWELAGRGDPCWDIGSVWGDYLSFWLNSVPITGETPPDRFLDLTWCPLDRMQPAIRAFWRAYVAQMELDGATAADWLVRAVRYTAARLVQSAYEQLQASLYLTGNVVCMLQLSWNILQRPAEAAGQLLGLSLRGGGAAA